MTLIRFFDLTTVPAVVMLLMGILVGGVAFGLSDGGPMGIQLFERRWWFVLVGIVGAVLLGMRYWTNRNE
ncbi:MAG: hypothetical protein BGO63_03800 [Candidatus Accumulibacter sp. 66-26]|mgnify:CR=1 FL=1|nr:MAG: hypothetical protein BGO63_03800 [Candidatus Accumulibacter sp. 66-26]